MIRAVCFDFDGTIVDSNNIKRNAFLSLAKNFPRGAEFVANVLGQNPPLDRYSVFAKMAKEYGISKEDERSLASNFNHIVHEKIVSAPFMPGALECIQKLSKRGKHLSINSATPKNELISIVQEKLLQPWFSDIMGRPSNKIDNLKNIMAHYHLQPYEILMIGDGADDQICAETVGAHFQPVFQFRGNQLRAKPCLFDLQELDLLSDES